MATAENEANPSINSPERQEARAFLRERFLRCVSSLSGINCTMKTVEHTDISGVFQGMDIHVQSMFVKNLSTPYTKHKHSLIRTSDVFYVRFPDIKSGKMSKENNSTT